MARSFLTAVNLNKNELQNAAVQNLGTAPSSPVKGQLYYNSTGGDDTLYWWNGSQWIAAKAAAGATPAATVTTQAVGDAAVVGVSTNFAREDHKHGRESFGTITAQTTFGASSGNGAAVTLARSDHVHGTPVHDAAAHSAIPLSALAAATADVSHGGFKITSLADPIAATDGANKQYVDNLVNGLSWKDSVKAASTGNVTISGNQTVDGVALGTPNRVLLKNQTSVLENGIYVVNSGGTWTRALDADSGGDLANASVWVEGGTVNADTGWVMTSFVTDPSIDNQVWVQFAGGGAITAGAGMTQSGNTLNVIAGDTSLTVAADDVRVNTAVIATVASVAVKATKFAAAVAAATSSVINHALNTKDVTVDVYRVASPFDSVECDVERTDVNNVTVRFAVAPAAGDYRVVVVG